MPRDKREVEAGLLNKGFVSRSGDHRYFVYHALSGQKTLAMTKTSHGRGFDLDDHLLGQMARQCGLARKSFLNLIDCPLERPEYETLLRQAGKL